MGGKGLRSNVVARALGAALMTLTPLRPAAAPATAPTPPALDFPALEESEALLRGPLAEEPGGSPAPRTRPPGAPWPGRSPAPYPRPSIVHPRPFEPQVPLPPLAPYKGAYVGKQSARLRPSAAPPPTVAAPATAAARVRPRVEQNPYDPVGLRLGSTVLFPYFETSVGSDDNPNQIAPAFRPRPSAFLRGSGGVSVRSDWSRHSLEGELRGGYSNFFGNASASRPDAAGQLAARYDVTRDTDLELRGRLSLDTMRPGAPGLAPVMQNAESANAQGQAARMTNRPTILDLGTQIGPTQRLSRFEVSARGTFDRVWFQNAYFSDGTVFDLARTSYNEFGALLRLAYEATPRLKPFVEATPTRRVHDEPTDMNGFYRDSTGYILRGGAVFDVTELVQGEVSAGYGERFYADPRLPPLRGPVIDATLLYTPSALTKITLHGVTSLNETTVPDASGALTRSITATLSHDLLRNLNVTVSGNYLFNNYQGSDVRERGGGASVELDYKITRSVSLRGGFMHQRLDSTLENADFTASVYSLGLRFQL